MARWKELIDGLIHDLEWYTPDDQTHRINPDDLSEEIYQCEMIAADATEMLFPGETPIARRREFLKDLRIAIQQRLPASPNRAALEMALQLLEMPGRRPKAHQAPDK